MFFDIDYLYNLYFVHYLTCHIHILFVHRLNLCILSVYLHYNCNNVPCHFLLLVLVKHSPFRHIDNLLFLLHLLLVWLFLLLYLRHRNNISFFLPYCFLIHVHILLNLYMYCFFLYSHIFLTFYYFLHTLFLLFFHICHMYMYIVFLLTHLYQLYHLEHCNLLFHWPVSY